MDLLPCSQVCAFAMNRVSSSMLSRRDAGPIFMCATAGEGANWSSHSRALETAFLSESGSNEQSGKEEHLSLTHATTW